MLVDERCVVASSDRLFLDQVKKEIGMREPPSVITRSKGDMDGRIVSLQSNEDADTSIEETKASCDSSTINLDCCESACEMKTGTNHSFPNRVGESSSSYQELHMIIRTLYDKLQISDSKLVREKERRRARERNITTMANEIISNKATIENQKQRIEEMKENLKDEHAEKAKLKQRLEHKHLAFHDDQEDMCRNLEQELHNAREMYDTACVDRERRIRDMSEAHAKQCNLLCREVVESNRENKLLRERIELLQAPKNKSTSFDSVVEKTRPEKEDGPKPRTVKNVLNLIAFVYAVFAIFVFNGNSSTRRQSLSPLDPSIVPNGNNHNSSYHSMNPRLQSDTSIKSRVFFPPDQERQQETATESLSAVTRRRRFQTQVTKVGTKLKKAVVTDEGETRRQMPIQNAFLTLKRSRLDEDDEDPPAEGARTQAGNTPLIVGWFQKVKGFMT